MSKNFSFKKVKKNTLTVEMKDGSALVVLPPTKGMMNQIAEMQESAKTETEQINSIYRTLEIILANNRGGIKINRQELEDAYDIEDCLFLLEAFQEFMGEIQSQKN